MKLHYHNNFTEGALHLIIRETDFDHFFFLRDRKDKFLTLAWNNGPEQSVSIDGINYSFPEQSVLPLMVNQSFQFAKPEQVIAWQFNRDFYCIVNHDREVGCVGFLFYGSGGILFLKLDPPQLRKMQLLLDVFIDEMDTADDIQQEMLQMLLKRLIIILTRIGKQQYIDQNKLPDHKLDILRQYNLLVEHHYRTAHSVAFYAAQLHKSPKTLANYFALYNQKSPLAVIQERIILEAKRLLMYTNKSAKEIAYDLGFEDAAYFSNFFRKQTGSAPSDFRYGQRSAAHTL